MNAEPTPLYTDTKVNTGTAGALIIRDHGSVIEYWITCTDPATNVASCVWSGVVNGVPVGGTVRLSAGFNSKLVGSWTVSTNQTVSFHMNATGTQGLGGPADVSAAIVRVIPTAPPAPVMRPPSQITKTTMLVQFDSAGDGGSGVTGWDLQQALDEGFSQGLKQTLSTGTSTADNLTPGTRYWFRARGVNAYGAGAWAAPVSAVTLASVFVSDGQNWLPAGVLVDDGSGADARQAEVWVSDGAAWKLAG